MAASPILNRFLSDVKTLAIQPRNGWQLQNFLQIEPPLPEIYNQMVVELRQSYPSGEPNSETKLLRQCEDVVPRVNSAGPSWTSFCAFMKLYLVFLRDARPQNLLETYNELRGLVK